MSVEKKAPVIIVKKKRTILRDIDTSVKADERPEEKPATLTLRSGASKKELPANNKKKKKLHDITPFYFRLTNLKDEGKRDFFMKANLFYTIFPNFMPKFYKNEFRLMKIGIREDILKYIQENKDCGLTKKFVKKFIGSIAKQRQYKMKIKAGAKRYDLDGNVCGIVTEEEEIIATNHLRKVKKILEERLEQRLKAAREANNRDQPHLPPQAEPEDV